MWTMWNYTLHLTVLGKDSIICVLVINANYVFIFYWETYVVKILRTVSMFCKNKKYKIWGNRKDSREITKKKDET